MTTPELIGLAISVGGFVVSTVGALLVAWGKMAAIDARQEERLKALHDIVKGISDDSGIHSARIEMHGSKIAVLESQVGSLRALRSPVWKGEK